MIAPAIAKIVRENDQTIRNWLKRLMAEGIEGLKDRADARTPTESHGSV